MKKRKKRLASLLQIPAEVALGGVNVCVYEDKNCIIENANYLISYDEHFVRVGTSLGVLCVKGKCMGISTCTDRKICIFGKISGFYYEGGDAHEV